MKPLLFILSLLFLTGCYTQVQYVKPDKVTHVLATNNTGDTVKVDIHSFKTIYYDNPTYYNEWRFYWRDNWVTPYSYYRYYYRPYQPIWIYYPYPSWDIYTGNKRPEPKVNKPSQPRSTGTTRTNSSTPRTSNPEVQRSRTPQTSQPKSTGRSNGSSTNQRKRNN